MHCCMPLQSRLCRIHTPATGMVLLATVQQNPAVRFQLKSLHAAICAVYTHRWKPYEPYLCTRLTMRFVRLPGRAA